MKNSSLFIIIFFCATTFCSFSMHKNIPVAHAVVYHEGVSRAYDIENTVPLFEGEEIIHAQAESVPVAKAEILSTIPKINSDGSITQSVMHDNGITMVKINPAPENQDRTKKIITLNESGKLSAIDTFHVDNSFNQMAYDGQGNLLESKTYDINNLLISETSKNHNITIKYSYDENKKLTQKNIYDSKNNKQSTENYQNGVLSQKITYYSWGKQASTENYNENGTLISKTIYGANGKQASTENYKNGKLVSKIIYHYLSGNPESIENYDADGKITSIENIIPVSFDGSQSTTISYPDSSSNTITKDAQGNIIRKIVITKSGDTTYYKYARNIDKDGNGTVTITGTDKYEIEKTDTVVETYKNNTLVGKNIIPQKNWLQSIIKIQYRHVSTLISPELKAKFAQSTIASWLSFSRTPKPTAKQIEAVKMLEDGFGKLLSPATTLEQFSSMLSSLNTSLIKIFTKISSKDSVSSLKTPDKFIALNSLSAPATTINVV